AVAVMILVPLWYAQYFPRPYIETLTGITDDYALALDTHDKLRRFPGFGGRADELLAEIMVRRSEAAQGFGEIRAADAALRGLEGYDDVADRLIGEYWLRRGEEELLRGRRDEALIYADRARVGGDAAAVALAARLVDVDYPNLRQSFRFGASLAQWEPDWTSQSLMTIDAGRRARRLELTAARAPLYDTRVTALQHVPVSRALGVDEPGSAGAFLFDIDIEHADVEQILLTLEAPSGVSASFMLSGAGAHHEVQVTERSELATLADEDRQGVWRLTLVDRSEGGVGRLLRWGLLFAEELRGWQDVPDRGLDIPDPVRTDQIDVQLSADGRIGVARPARPDAVGALTIWDFENGRALGDLEVDTLPTHSVLTPDATRLITVSGNALTIWDTEARSALARIATQTGFVLPPAIGIDGEYIAIAEELDADEALYSLLRADDGELVASIEGTARVRDWVLGPQARYLMLVGPGRSVRVIDPRRNETLLELPHAYDPVLLAATSQDLVISVDVAGDIYAWDLSEAERGGAGRFVGVTVDPLGLSLAADGASVAYEAEHSHVVVRDLPSNMMRLSVRVPSTSGPARTRLADDGSRLVTASGTLLQVWDIPPPLAGTPPRAYLSAAALDETAQIAALGYRDGHLEIRTTAQIQEGIDAQDDIAYIGHQGAVTSLAINSSRGVITSGGVDGVVRAWDLASGAPTESYMRHPEGAIQTVTVSRDGSWLASGADGSVRVWRSRDGELALELPVNGVALAVAISPDSTRLAAGDSAGNVFVATIADPGSVRSGRAQAAVAALAFSADGRRLASGDRSGRIQLWDSVDARAIGGATVLPQAIRWLGFSDDGEFLVAQTTHWVHRLRIDPLGLTSAATRLVGIDREPGAAAVPGTNAIRIVGGRDGGSGVVEEIFWGAASIPPAPDTRSIDRDWSGILSLRVNERSDIEAVRY
ncbi:MAG TPA: proprotein convertase P-domain-containing protein, partial [Gammaproteobacteria bacterium]|nr:proprotein convertase P-domain-containing protein [Gammaproteobacteria bacterium]